MNSEPLSINHRELLFDRLRSIPIPISEFSFANLYLFRDTHRYEVILGDEVFVRGVSYDGRTYMMPTRDIRDADPDVTREMAEQADYLYPIPELWLSAFDEDRYKITYDKGDSDYLYLTERIATYAGKKLHKKKNLLNFFLKHYRHEGLPLTEERIPDAIRILDAWQAESGQSRQDTDYAACREAVEMMDELVLCGGIYYTEGAPSGFIHGQELNDETYALHFAKGLTKLKGIYQYMFNSFAGILPNRYRYLNFEQDLGKEALRHSKESYIPEMKLRKYRVSLKK